MQINDLIKLLRPKHYIKNIVVFIPLIFSLNFKEVHLVLLAIIAFLSFCFLASAIYVFNDIIDFEQDKLHPIKCNRPIASGRITLKQGFFLTFILLFLSCICANSLGIYALLIIFAYTLLNILYSYKFKYYPIIDVFCIALGFILRILIGCAAIMVKPSPLVILLTFFTSMFFTFAKRKLEFILQPEIIRRKAIQEYNIQLLDQYITVNAILSIAFYFTYMLDNQTILRSGSEYLYITVIPFALIIFRLLFLISTATKNDDPAFFIYNDKMVKFFMLLYFLLLFAVLI